MLNHVMSVYFKFSHDGSDGVRLGQVCSSNVSLFLVRSS